jgi:hypothetical protein
MFMLMQSTGIYLAGYETHHQMAVLSLRLRRLPRGVPHTVLGTRSTSARIIPVLFSNYLLTLDLSTLEQISRLLLVLHHSRILLAHPPSQGVSLLPSLASALRHHSRVTLPRVTLLLPHSRGRLKKATGRGHHNPSWMHLGVLLPIRRH